MYKNATSVNFYLVVSSTCCIQPHLGNLQGTFQGVYLVKFSHTGKTHFLLYNIFIKLKKNSTTNNNKNSK